MVLEREKKEEEGEREGEEKKLKGSLQISALRLMDKGSIMSGSAKSSREQIQCIYREKISVCVSYSQ